MKFSELRLMVAISDSDAKGDPVTDEQRLQYAENVREAYTALSSDVYFPWSVSTVIDCGVKYRKSTALKTKVRLAKMHGCQCFWKHREKGPCCEEVEGGHVIARAAGAGDLTVANGMIECRSHNNQRRERSIEEYLSSTDTTK